MIKPIMTSFDETVTISYLKSCCETKRCFASYSKTEFLLYVAIVSSKQLMWEVKGSIRCESVCPTLFMSYCTNGGGISEIRLLDNSFDNLVVLLGYCSDTYDGMTTLDPDGATTLGDQCDELWNLSGSLRQLKYTWILWWLVKVTDL